MSLNETAVNYVMVPFFCISVNDILTIFAFVAPVTFSGHQEAIQSPGRHGHTVGGGDPWGEVNTRLHPQTHSFNHPGGYGTHHMSAYCIMYYTAASLALHTTVVRVSAQTMSTSKCIWSIYRDRLLTVMINVFTLHLNMWQFDLKMCA